MLVNRLALITKRLTESTKFQFSQPSWQKIPRFWNLKHTKQEKRMLYGKETRIFPKYLFNFNDTLAIPGVTDSQSLYSLYEEFIITRDTPLSPQFVALMLYNFSKNNFLNEHTWVKIEPYIGLNRGEYRQRSIFGCFYAVIRYGKQEYIQFFIDEMVGQKLTFTDMQAVQIMQAFNESKHVYSMQFKHKFWQKYWKPHYMNIINDKVRIRKISDAFKIFNTFDKFQYYQDEQLWNNIFGWFQRRKGWVRTEIIQKIYPLTGTFPKAKELFDVYYNELSTNPHVKWRYNLQELRLYSSEEMIAKSQDNIQMKPFDRTLFKRQDQARLNTEYNEWLKDGARQKQSELVKDKAQSLAYAIKNRYESLKADNKVDFSKLSVEQFNDMFGGYDPDLLYQSTTPSEVNDEIFGQEQAKRKKKEQQNVQPHKEEKPKQKEKKKKK